MKLVAMAASASLFFAIGGISTNAKVDRPTCIERCKSYCPSSVRRQFYCQSQCSRKCRSNEPDIARTCRTMSAFDPKRTSALRQQLHAQAAAPDLQACGWLSCPIVGRLCVSSLPIKLRWAINTGQRPTYRTCFAGAHFCSFSACPFLRPAI
jgi:hypothetical protein